MTQMTRHPWLLWLTALLALAGLFVSARGWALAAGLAVEDPERHAVWRRVGVAYLGYGALSAAAWVATAIAIRRHASRRSNSGSPAV